MPQAIVAVISYAFPALAAGTVAAIAYGAASIGSTTLKGRP